MLKIGTRVKYARENKTYDRNTMSYPPRGTKGTVVANLCCFGFEVRFDNGIVTTCEAEDLEELRFSNWVRKFFGKGKKR